MKSFSKAYFIISLILCTNFITSFGYAQVLNKPLDGENLGTLCLPLEIGNVWTYRDFYWQPFIKLSIIDTLTIEGNKYYLKEDRDIDGYIEAFQYLRLREDGYYGCRILDSNIARFPNEDYLYYKKDANVGDVWSQEEVRGKVWYHIVLDTIQVASFWGSFLPVKIVEITDSSLTRYWEYWSEEFGLVQQQYSDLWSGGWILLWGCYINGQQYGDTVLVSVDDEIQNHPTDFNLFQNYPNPFNSTTIIPYEISKTSFVSIIVYDVLGNEITQLVNATKSPGKYQVTFDINIFNGILSTGVYFYKIFLDQKQKTKKMIYLK